MIIYRESSFMLEFLKFSWLPSSHIRSTGLIKLLSRNGDKKKKEKPNKTFHEVPAFLCEVHKLAIESPTVGGLPFQDSCLIKEAAQFRVRVFATL